MPVLRVLVYGMTDNQGGIEAFLMTYFRNINKENIIFDFVTDYPEIAFHHEILSLGGRIFHIPSRHQSLTGHLRELKKIVLENNYKIVYYNILSSTGGLSLLPLMFKKDVVKVVHSHNNSVKRMWLHRLFRPFLNILTTHKLACSTDSGRFMFGAGCVKKDKLRIINNAIDCEKFRFNEEIRREIRQDLGLEGKKVVGFVGRLCHQKNPMFLLEIFAELKKIHEDSALLVVGDGDEKSDVIRRISELGLGDSVSLLGMRKDVPRLLQAMDVFLLPSRFEGFGIVLLEAQACGLPAFASQTVVPSEVNVTGLLKFISLEQPPEYWAGQISEALDYSRTDYSTAITAAGFDINSEAKKLETFFCELS